MKETHTRTIVRMITYRLTACLRIRWGTEQ